MFHANTQIKTACQFGEKNSKSVLIPCFVQNHIKYTDNDFTMFGAKTLAELCLSETNVFSNVLALTINEYLQC